MRSLAWFHAAAFAPLWKFVGVASIAVSAGLLAYAANAWRAVSELRAASVAPPAEAVATGEAAVGWAAALPFDRVDLPALLQAESGRHRVMVQRASYSRTALGAPDLVNVQASVEASGRYNDIKAWLVGLQQVAPMLSLHQLELHALDDGQTVEARLKLAVLSRDLP